MAGLANQASSDHGRMVTTPLTANAKYSRSKPTQRALGTGRLKSGIIEKTLLGFRITPFILAPAALASSGLALRPQQLRVRAADIVGVGFGGVDGEPLAIPGASNPGDRPGKRLRRLHPRRIRESRTG